MEYNKLYIWLKENGYIIDRLPSELGKYKCQLLKDYTPVARILLEEFSGTKAKKDFFIHDYKLYTRIPPNEHNGDEIKDEIFEDIYKRFSFKRNEKKIKELCDVISQDLSLDMEKTSGNGDSSSAMRKVEAYLNELERYAKK